MKRKRMAIIKRYELKRKRQKKGNYKAFCAKVQTQKTRKGIATLFALNANAVNIWKECSHVKRNVCSDVAQ